MISFLQYLKKSRELSNGNNKLSVFKHLYIYNEWRRQLKNKYSPLYVELPWITIVAKDYLQNYLSNKIKDDLKIFEYGSGGSSLFFLKYASEVISVEHDGLWFKKVNEYILSQSIKCWKGYFEPPIELSKVQAEVLNASDPKDYFTKAGNFSFKNYVSVIEEFSDNYFDLVLVDGRSRPACIAHSIKKIKKGGLLVVDNAEREYYNVKEIVPETEFELVLNLNGALICTEQFTQTNIFLKK